MSENARSNRGNDVRRLLRVAEFEATDSQEREACIKDLMSPSILGLKQDDAAAVADTLRDVMFKRLAQEDVDDGETDEAIGLGSEEPEENTDDVDFIKDDDEDEEDTSLNDDDPETDGIDDEITVGPGDDIGPGLGLDAPDDLGSIFDLEREQVGFPDEEIIDEEPTGFPPFGEKPMGEETSVSLEHPGDGIAVNLPGGQTLEVELQDNSTEEGGSLQPTKEVFDMTPQDEAAAQAAPQNTEKPELEAAGNVSHEAFLKRRSDARRAMISQAEAQQKMPEHIAPSTEKPLGNDTSYGGSQFQMANGQTGVATTEDPNMHSTMTLQNSEGNSLQDWNSDFSPNRIPTKNPGNMMQSNAQEQATFENEQSGLFTQKFEDTALQVPTQGKTDNLWGAKNFNSFDMPTQKPENTGQRKHTASTEETPLSVFATPEWEQKVAYACQTKTCMNGHQVTGDVEPVQCQDCGVVYALCNDCIENMICPVCSGESREAQVNYDLYCGTPNDRQEFCDDSRGDDVNGDGGFRTDDKKGHMPKKQDARDMKVDDGEFETVAALQQENVQLKQANERLQVEMARLAKAAEVTYQMIDAGQIEAKSAMSELDRFFSTEMDVPALESLRQIASSLPRQGQQERLAEVQAGMTKEAGTMPIQPAGLLVNVNPSQSMIPNESLSDVLQEVLSSSILKDEDFDPETGIKISR